ncbi:MAG: hypothetical protein ACRDBL_11280 [Rhabdaerophilum sp.]
MADGTQTAQTPPVTPPANGAPPPATPPAGGDPWFSKADLGLSQETRDYLSTKNYGGLEDAFKAKRTFETLARDRNALTAPDPAKLGEWDGWQKLGWEPDAAKYGQGAPVYEKFKGDPDFEPFHADIVKTAHELKVPLPIAKALADKIGGHMFARNEQLDAAEVREKTALDQALRTKWGPQYDANVEMAKRAARATGLGEADQGELEAILSSPRFIEHFHRIGSMMGEDKLVTASNSGAGGVGTMGPHQARAERLRLENDPDYVQSLRDPRHPMHQVNKEKRSRLTQIEAGEAR